MTSAQILPDELVWSLEIGFGTAKLIIHYADEDVASIHNGTFSLLATNWHYDRGSMHMSFLEQTTDSG